MKQKTIITAVIGIALGVIAYKVINKKDENKSNFSSACGCGG